MNVLHFTPGFGKRDVQSLVVSVVLYGSVFILILFLFGHIFQIHSLLFLSVTCRCPFWTGHTFPDR